MSQKVLSNEDIVKFNSQLNSALFKSVAYLENYRNLNGKQFNLAIIDESKKLRYPIKAGTSSMGGKFPTALPLLFGESMGMEQFDKVVRNLILNEHSTIYLHPSIYGTNNTLMQGKSYRNEPEEWVKKLQQILYDYTIGIFDEFFGD